MKRGNALFIASKVEMTELDFRGGVAYMDGKPVFLLTADYPYYRDEDGRRAALPSLRFALPSARTGRTNGSWSWLRQSGRF